MRDHAVAGCLALVILSACETREAKKGYLARVGNSYLTQEEIGIPSDTVLLPSDPRLRDYASRWINNELLYQEAQRQGVDNSEDVQQQLAVSRKQLSIEALLQKEIYADTVRVSEDSIRSYLNMHTNDFLIREDVIRLNLAVFSLRERANVFRAKLVRGSPWGSALQEVLSDTALRASLLTHVEAKYYTQHSLYPPELWRVAGSLFIREASFPVRTQGGFVVIQPLAILRQGTRADVEMVGDEIRQRLVVERRRQQYAEFISRLRTRYDVEVPLP